MEELIHLCILCSALREECGELYSNTKQVETTLFIQPHFEKRFGPMWLWSLIPVRRFLFLSLLPIPTEQDGVYETENPGGFNHHFTKVQTLIYYILTHQIYRYFGHMDSILMQGTWFSWILFLMKTNWWTPVFPVLSWRGIPFRRSLCSYSLPRSIIKSWSWGEDEGL